MSSGRASPRRAKHETWRIVITGVSAAYLVNAAIGTWISVRDGLAGTPFGWDLRLEPLSAFVFGLGTALSAPLVLLLALLAANLLIWQRSDMRRRGVGAMILLASGFLIGMLAEPITWKLFRTGQVVGLTTGVVIANIVLPVILVIIAMRAWSQGENTGVEERPARA